MATTQNRTFYGGSTAPGSGVYPEDVKVLKVFANYAENEYNPLGSSDTSIYIPTVDKRSYDDGNIVGIIDRVLAAGGSPIVTKYGAEFTYSSGNALEYKFVNVSGDSVTEMTINRSTGTVTSRNNFLTKPVEVEYSVASASDVASIINTNGLPYVKVGDVIANLYKIEPNKYTFRTTHIRVDDDINYLDVVDYIVDGATWTTVTKTVSGGDSGSAYLNTVASDAPFDTTGHSGMHSVLSVDNVPEDGIYQLSVMLHITPKTASATKSDLVLQFTSSDNTGWPSHTFHAVVDDSQTFAQQLSFSTSVSLKAGQNILKISCDSLNTQYLVFVDELTIAQLVNGVYHNGDDFDEVHTLPEAPDFNNDDGVLVDGATGGPRFMFWKTLAKKILGFFGMRKGTDVEYLYSMTDSNGAFLFGIKKDGSVDWSKGIPSHIQYILDSIVSTLNLKVDKQNGKSLINSVFSNGVNITSTENYLLAVTDCNGRTLLSITKDGTIEQISDAMVNFQKKESGKTLINELFANGVSSENKEELFVIVDNKGRTLLSIDKSGKIEQIKEIEDSFQKKIAGKSVVNEIFAEGVSVTTDSKNLLVFTDKAGRVLLNIRRDGVIQQLLDSANNKVDKEPGFSLAPKFIRRVFSIAQKKDYLLVLTDKDDRVILSVDKTGKIAITQEIDSITDALKKKVDKVHGKSLIDSRFENGLSYPKKNYLKIVTDAVGRFVFGVKDNGEAEFGTKVNFSQGVNWTSENLTDLQKALAANGVNLSGENLYDWSDKTSLQIGVPKLAIANIVMSRALPQYKGDKANAEIEFWDLKGNYFKKKIIIDVQGNSTQWYPKKNYAIDLCNDDWIGDDTFSLKFGNWVEQDSYHLKAWWVDMFRGCGQVYYNLLTDIWKYKRGPLNIPWMKAKINSDRLTNRGFGCSYDYEPADLDLRLPTGATCHPEGFPMILHYNGDFLGIYSWSIKKHRKNYHMDKKNYSEILIDGVLRTDEFWAGHDSIDWTEFELKNPKTLITMDGNKYDGDNPIELIDPSSPSWTNSKDQKNTYKTKRAIEALSDIMPQIEAAVSQYGVDSQEVIDLYNKYFDVDNLIDYIIFSDVILDTDTGVNNVLWTTWDGVKWFACPYDIDRILGIWGGYCTGNQATMLLNRQHLPTYYIGQNSTFRTRLADRYRELRDGGVLSTDNLLSYCTRWIDAVGFDNYKKEFDKWPNNIVNNNAVVNEEYWEIDSTDIQNSGTWSSSTQYEIGDVCYYGAGNVSGYGSVCGYYKFTCKKQNTNTPPFSQLRCKDSLWRLYAWINTQLSFMDTFYNYNP